MPNTAEELRALMMPLIERRLDQSTAGKPVDFETFNILGVELEKTISLLLSGDGDKIMDGLVTIGVTAAILRRSHVEGTILGRQ